MKNIDPGETLVCCPGDVYYSHISVLILYTHTLMGDCQMKIPHILIKTQN